MADKTKFMQLKSIFETLHGPKGCLWDKEQTHKSILPGLREEVREFIAEVNKGDTRHMKEELGDILFTLVNLARFIGVDPEDALRRTTNKFARRFTYIEQRLQRQGKTPQEVSLAEMDALWEESKGKKEESNG